MPSVDDSLTQSLAFANFLYVQDSNLEKRIYILGGETRQQYFHTVILKSADWQPHVSVWLTCYSSLSIIKVPAGKAVKVTFKKFLLSEPGQENSKDCRKDYVEIDGKKWVQVSLKKKKNN